MTLASTVRSSILKSKDTDRQVDTDSIPFELRSKVTSNNTELHNAFVIVHSLLDMAESENASAKSMEEDNAEAQSLANELKMSRLETKSAHSQFIQRMSNYLIHSTEWEKYKRYIHFLAGKIIL